jgi:hypothetical protein
MATSNQVSGSHDRGTVFSGGLITYEGKDTEKQWGSSEEISKIRIGTMKASIATQAKRESKCDSAGSYAPAPMIADPTTARTRPG